MAEHSSRGWLGGAVCTKVEVTEKPASWPGTHTCRARPLTLYPHPSRHLHSPWLSELLASL